VLLPTSKFNTSDPPEVVPTVKVYPSTIPVAGFQEIVGLIDTSTAPSAGAVATLSQNGVSSSHN